ncbi:HK97 family phage prohead protease [Streptomyces sp. CB03234]|uniref:HK97 family phage prohead protease n=1 Tax=Streptomyces sp. (strain CB03234) TaxID=1703937 RepID=UPI00093DA7A2|nr:HK97 family phage prohead protease [Streptomyces sp. CB03234]
MTTMTALREQAAAARSAAAGTTAMPVPRDRPESPELRFSSQLRAKKVERDGQEWYQIEGYASAFEQGYEMWDMFGPYTEIVSHGAADATLAADPEVVFRFNHAGTPMAGTRNGRLQLWADDAGLGQRAWVNPKRADVQLLVQALEDDDVREQSFMFRITSGQWSPDYTEYRINSFDLDRGDVGPVTYGANPHTSVSARSGEFLASIPNLPPIVAREAYERLAARSDLTIPATRATVPATAPAAPAAPTDAPKMGRSIAMLRTRLLVSDDDY